MNRISNLSFLICLLAIGFTGVFYYPKWNKAASEATISWDVSGYYMYLPATFIYKDIKKCSFKDEILKKYNPTPEWQQSFLHEPSGNYVMKYTLGMSVMYSPFFLLGHIYAKTSGQYPIDGFSRPYQIAIAIGMFLYSFIGLWVLKKILLNFFSDKVTALTLLTIVMGSNYLNYNAIDGAMPHNVLFMLYAILILKTIVFYRSPSIYTALQIGALCGLLTLIRPTEILSILIPLFWNISNTSDVKERRILFSKRPALLIIPIITFLSIVILQFIYWKNVSGNWFVYTYGQEGFDWFSPHYFNGLFSYKAGWLVYTPVMILSIAGFFFLFRQYRKICTTIIIFILPFTYLCFAWHEWWYAGSLGQRSMIQAYPMLSFPLAALFTEAFKTLIKKTILIAFITICILYTFWLTHQAHRGGLFRPGETNKAFFWATLGKFKIPLYYESFLDNPEAANISLSGSGKILFSKSDNEWLQAGEDFSEKITLVLDSNRYKYLDIQATIYTPEKEWNIWKMHQVVVAFKNKGEQVKYNFIRVNRMIGDNSTRTVSLIVNVPDSDEVDVYCWNPGSNKRMLINEMKIFGY